MTILMRDLELFNEYLAEEHPDLPPLPSHWIICDRCRGEGELQGYPGVYTQDDFDEDPDFFDDYREYRRPCEDCGGSGKLKVATEDGGSETSRLFREWVRDMNEMRAIEAAERRMGA